jgi:response regulator of citrate/malate metabolism
MFGVLVVEDEPVIARLLASCVTGNRWFDLAGVAGTVELAVGIARREEPDLVLLDFCLPDAVAGGFAVWDALHQLPKVPDVIAVTALREVDTVAKAQRYGAFDYAIKPFSRDTIAAKLADYADFRRRRPAAQEYASQSAVDRYFNPRHRTSALPAGLQAATLESVICVLRTADAPLRAIEVAVAASVDRGTANRYLTYLCDQGIAGRVPEHGRPGHPAYLYRLAPGWLPPDT